ncbi:hypothetical protein JCM19233_6876 [Vibrio astriarenae]|nr:hypothetical protein JCM19233_6876 [Vibrio sp. C7]
MIALDYSAIYFNLELQPVTKLTWGKYLTKNVTWLNVRLLKTKKTTLKVALLD